MQLTPEVKDILSRSVVRENRLDLPPGQLDRRLYLEVAKVIELLGGKWVRKERAHIFEEAADEVVADAVATGAVIDFRKEFQFFETPPHIARWLVSLANIPHQNRSTSPTVLEPSAGRGRIIEAIRGVGIEPFACELWEKNRERLVEMGVTIIGWDFLEMPLWGAGFDMIVANPPFARQQDVKHVTRMWEQLRPGGRLVSVMSPRWYHGNDSRSVEFRSLYGRYVQKWEMLEEGAFKSSGTFVRAGVIVMDKPSPE